MSLEKLMFLNSSIVCLQRKVYCEAIKNNSSIFKKYFKYIVNINCKNICIRTNVYERKYKLYILYYVKRFTFLLLGYTHNPKNE